MAKKEDSEVKGVDMVTVEMPWDEAPRAMGHVERPGGVGKAVGGEHTDHGWDAALQRELDLGLVGVPRGKGHR